MGVNPFWSERVQEEMRLREARPEGLPPVPESGDEEEVARTPLRAAQEETAAQRGKASLYDTGGACRGGEKRAGFAGGQGRHGEEKERSGGDASRRWCRERQGPGGLRGR